MATPEDDFAGDSLFEGMVLFSPSDLSSSSPPPPSPPRPKSPSPPSSPPPTSESQSRPLDEDLFSDLTLQSQPQSQPPEASDSVPTASRQVSRKKKRAVRIGYARDYTNSKPSDVRDRVSETREVRSELDISPDPNPQFVSEAQNQTKVEILPSDGEDGINESREEKSEVEIRPNPDPQLQSESPIQAKDEILVSGGEEREPLDSMEDKQWRI